MCTDSRFPDFGTSWRLMVSFTSRPRYPGQTASGNHYIEGWVGPRTSLKDMEKLRFLTLTGLEVWSLRRPSRRKKTPWSESATELHRPSNHRLSAKWLPTFADRGCHVVSVTDLYGRILGFIDRSRYFSIKQLLSCTHEAEWTPFQTHYSFFSDSAGNRTRASGSVAKNSNH
jgi:hypothetical protein